MNIEELYNLPDFWKQIYEALPVIDKVTAIEVGIPNKAANIAFNELRSERNQKLTCRVCGLVPTLHVCDEDNDECNNFEENVRGDSDCWCISNEGWYINKVHWNICLHCETYHNICQGCNRYCKLVSHGGCFVKKNPQKERDDIWVSTQSQNDSGEDNEYVLPIESNINYISKSVAFPTGTDGGYVHVWTCDTKDCPEYDIKYAYSDK